MAGKTAILKLLVNIPVEASLSGAYYAKSKTEGYSDQVKLRGRWKGQFVGTTVEWADGDVYLNLAVVRDLLADGIIEQLPEADRDGNPAYKVLRPDVTVQREQSEGGKTFTRIVATGAAPAPKAPVAPRPVPTTVKHQAAGPGMPASVPMPQAVAVAEPPDHWAELSARYAKCAAIASATWEDKVTDAGLVAAAATLFIEANRRNLPVAPAAEAFAAMPPALEGDDDASPF